MIERITFAHELDPSIRATFRAPSRAVYAEFWGALNEAQGRFDYVACLNLTIACREQPEADELRIWIDEFWSGLPDEAAQHLYSMSGHFLTDIGGKPTKVDATDGTGEIVDLRAMLGKVDHLPEAERRTAIEAADAHRRAIEALAGPELCAKAFSGPHPHMSRLCVALPWGGYYVGRMPTSGARMTASRILRAGASENEAGAYAAAVRLALDCAIYPEAPVLSALFDKHPGAATKLGALVNRMGGGARVVEEK